VLGVAGAWLGGLSIAHDPARGVGPSHLDFLVTSLRVLRLGTLTVRGLEVSHFFGIVSNCRRSGPFKISRRYSGGGQRRRKTCRGPTSVAPTSKSSPKDRGIVTRPFYGWAGGICWFRASSWTLERVGVRRNLALRVRGVRRGSKAASCIAEIRSEVESYPAEIIYNMHETGPFSGASQTELTSRPDNDGRRGAPTQGRP